MFQSQSLMLTLLSWAAEMRAWVLAKGMSQADFNCLALAKRKGVPALTGDRKWLEIADAIGVEVRLMR